MRNGKKVVLHVEDKLLYQDLLAADLRRFAEVIRASSIIEAEAKFAANQGVIDVIVMDACVPGETPNTLPLVALIRQTFKGPMIASSGFPGFRKDLMAVGCDSESPKEEVGAAVLSALGL